MKVRLLIMATKAIHYVSRINIHHGAKRRPETGAREKSSFQSDRSVLAARASGDPFYGATRRLFAHAQSTPDSEEAWQCFSTVSPLAVAKM